MIEKYVIDVSNWYLADWRNSKETYDAADALSSEIPKKTAGVYYIYKEDELLYVGCTVNFTNRITSHIALGSNTKEFINSATSIHCFPIADKYEREMREYNDIINLKPTQNRQIPSLKVINRNKPLVEEMSAI